jgi:hypothetical protein
LSKEHGINKGEYMTHGSDLVDSIVAQAGILKGLTKREYFAVVALQGFLANAFYSEAEIGVDGLIPAAVGTADMLINELNKGDPNEN